MPKTPAAQAAPAAERLPVAIPLRDLAVAPENLRADAPADDGVAELAETIAAASVLQPLTVRPGRRKEAAAMALDGRRRLHALWRLREAGRIADDYPVPCFVETDPARQAAAVVLTNTAVPVHVADVIVAIGKMLQAGLTPEAIAAALGYGEIDIRRLAALSGLHPKAIEALKAGRIALRQAKLLARLPDRREQGEIAAAALNGMGFQEWRVTDRLDASQVTVRDRRFKVVGAARYIAAGGRVESDLFGERPDVLLDPEALQAAWTARVEALAADLRTGGVEVQVAVAPAEIDDPQLEPFGRAYGLGLDEAGLAAWRDAEAAQRAAEAALDGVDLSSPEAEADDDVPPDDLDDGERDASSAAGMGRGAPEVAVPVAVAPGPELDGVNHALHEVRTDVATRALVRAVADDPGTALVALVARLFSVLVLQQGRARGGGASTIGAEAYGRPSHPPIDALDGDVRRRLAARRAAWAAAGVSLIAWVAGLAHGERMALLAELVGLSLDLREERTSLVRRAARAEAVEIAALCGADVTLHWTPDAAFLAAHPKGKLLDMLDAMGAGESRAAACKKDELVSLVAECAAERGWAPAYLSWSAEPPLEADEDVDPGDVAGDAPGAPEPGTGDETSPPQSEASGETATPALSAPLAA